MNYEDDERTRYHQLSVSSSKPLVLNQSYRLIHSEKALVLSENLSLPELYLLQALLNQDFTYFSSDKQSEMFAEDNVLLVFNKTQVRRHTIDIIRSVLSQTSSFL